MVVSAGWGSFLWVSSCLTTIKIGSMLGAPDFCYPSHFDVCLRYVIPGSLQGPRGLCHMNFGSLPPPPWAPAKQHAPQRQVRVSIFGDMQELLSNHRSRKILMDLVPATRFLYSIYRRP